MIDILFIVFPNMSRILDDIAPISQSVRCIDDILESGRPNSDIPQSAQDAGDLPTWCSELKSGYKKLFLSVSLQRPNPNDKKPTWVNADDWPSSIRRLINHSKRTVFIFTKIEEFIYRGLEKSNADLDAIKNLANWYGYLNTSLTALKDQSLGNYFLIESKRLHEKTGIEKLNTYTKHEFHRLTNGSWKNHFLWTEIKRQLVSIKKPEKPRARTAGNCQVLTILDPSLSSWLEYRGEAMQKKLADHGISHDWTFFLTLSDLYSQIIASDCSVVINELWTAPSAVINKLATSFPNVQFVNMNHSSPSFTASLPTHETLAARFEMMESFDHLAAVHPNVFNGTVMESRRFELNRSKVISLPNPIRNMSIKSQRIPDSKLLSLSLVCRFCPIKNLGGQVAAVRKVAQIRPVSLVIVTTYNPGMGRFVRSLREAGVITTTVEWGDWKQMMHLIALYSDIGLQASLTESLNLVALEHMMLGKPVVGSPAIEYLPKNWQANPQDPDSIAKTILDHAKDLEKRGAVAREIAGRIRNENNKQFIESIQSLLD